jgi:putative NADPH-quinone reductase
MHILLVLAHPLSGSFAAAIAGTARDTLVEGGHTVDLLDLYRENFDPRLTASERAGYFDVPYDTSDVAKLVARLKAADGLVFVFPQWWFDFPAILKGFFDRVLAPGVAFTHDTSGGRILPRLENIKLLWVLTTTGSPWWIVRLYMGDPVRRFMRRAIAKLCSKRLNFRILSLHDMDRATDRDRRRYLERVRKALRGI